MGALHDRRVCGFDSELASGDPLSIKAAAADKLGELRSQNGVPQPLKQLVAAMAISGRARIAEDGGEGRRRSDRAH